MKTFDLMKPLSGANFGGVIRVRGAPGAQIAGAEAAPDALPSALADFGGRLLVPGMQAMANAPDFLVRTQRCARVRKFHVPCARIPAIP